MTTYERQELGLAGSINETGTTAHTGLDVAEIHCLTATTFAALEDSLATGDAITGVALPAGTVLRGRFTAFTLTSGAVRAYKSVSVS